MKLTVSWFSTQDFDQTKKFYSDVLGLKEVFGAPGWAEFAQSKGAEACPPRQACLPESQIF